MLESYSIIIIIIIISIKSSKLTKAKHQITLTCAGSHALSSNTVTKQRGGERFSAEK